MWNYFSGILMAIVWIVFCAALTWILRLAAQKFLKKSVDFFAIYGFALFFSGLAFLFLQKKTGLDQTCTFYLLPALLMALSCSAYKNMDAQERTIWLTGILFAISSFVSTWLLTDLGLITMMPYMVLGGVVSFVALRHRKRQIEIFLLNVCVLVTVHRGSVVWGMRTKGTSGWCRMWLQLSDPARP